MTSQAPRSSPAAAFLRIAACLAGAGMLAVPFLWLDHKVHTWRHRILVEYIHPETNEATVDGIDEPQPPPIYQNQVGSVVLTVNRADRRVRMGHRGLLGDSSDAIRALLRPRCYYDAKLLAYEDLWSERLLRRRERRRTVAQDGEDPRRPLAIVEATFAYCDPNGLTRRERRLRDRPQTADEWLDLLTRPPPRAAPN